jgi:hypothetical protein
MPSHIQMTDPNSDFLRVSVHEHDIQLLMDQYPMLTRTEVVDVIGRNGPVRSDVESELQRISAAKR